MMLSFINRIGRWVPKPLQRRIADHPGVLGLFEKISHGQFREISTPEGNRLVINPLFHANLAAADRLSRYEPGIRNAIIKFTQPGMTAYDIGANVGVFSFLFAFLVKKNGIVYAFEPEKNNYRCLEQSVARNDIHHIFIDKRAVGCKRGREIFDRRGGAFSGRLVGDGAVYDVTDNTELVETVSIDSLVADDGFSSPDIVKIDVEGNEGAVLEGMAHTLDTYHPIIICELHTHLGETGDRVINLLRDHDYAISDVGGIVSQGHQPATSIDISRHKHIVALKRK